MTGLTNTVRRNQRRVMRFCAGVPVSSEMVTVCQCQFDRSVYDASLKKQTRAKRAPVFATQDVALHKLPRGYS